MELLVLMHCADCAHWWLWDVTGDPEDGDAECCPRSSCRAAVGRRVATVSHDGSLSTDDLLTAFVLIDLVPGISIEALPMIATSVEVLRS